MPPGPPPKPIEQRIREGNRSKTPLPHPVLVSGRPMPDELASPPAHLPRDARDLWEYVVPPLVSCGILDRIDLPLVEAMCVQWARVCQARRVVDHEGLFTAGSVGQLREAPWVKIEREATSMFERLAQQMGIGPVGRTRLGLAEITRRSLAVELNEKLGPMNLTKADDVVDGDVAS